MATDKNYQLGYEYFFNGQYEDALKYYQKAVKVNDRVPDHHLWLGRTYLQLGDKDKALEYIQAALRLDPQNATAKQVLLDIRTPPAFNQEAEKYYTQGYVYFSRQEYEKAMKNYQQAIALDGTIAKYHLWLGRTYLKLNQKRKAKVEIDFTLKLDPQNRDANILAREDLQTTLIDPAYKRYLLAMYLYSQNKYKDAVNDFERAIKLDGQQGEYHFWLAKTLQRLNRPEKALAVMNAGEKVGSHLEGWATLYSALGNPQKTLDNDKLKETYTANNLTTKNMSTSRPIQKPVAIKNPENLPHAFRKNPSTFKGETVTTKYYR